MITHSFLSLHLVVVVLWVVRISEIFCCVNSSVWAGVAGACVDVTGALIGAGVSCTFPVKKSLRGFGSSSLILKGIAGAWDETCFSGSWSLTGFTGVSLTVLT